MELKPGDKLGAYEIVSLLGKGGMGEVWKARDPQIGRDVAIKVSAQQFTDRFEREVRAIGALNHPNICTLYHVGPNYLVMELVEGPTLAERIQEGPIPLAEALGLTKQIADALEAAHEKNIVHRDLKPANVKIRPDGSVKVLDFGLAKAGEAHEVTPDSPTLMPGTQIGMILGTAGYMSPEQARGKEVDRRADIWAFGVVLYEMTTGKRLFEGETVSDTLAAVLRAEPDLTLAPEKTRRLLGACLEKDPKKRLRDIGDMGRLLETELASAAPSQSRFGKGGWVAAGVFVLIAVAAGFGWWHSIRSVDYPLIRLDVDLGPDVNLPPAGLTGSAVILSPDGTRLAYVASVSGGPSKLYTRRLDQPKATELPGTEGASAPFFSPDGQWIGFNNSQQKISRISVEGGTPVQLSDQGGTASWGEDGIVFGSLGKGLLRIPSSGGGQPTGQPTVVTELTHGELAHVAPQYLPGGKAVLFEVNNGPGDSRIEAVTLADRRRKVLVGSGTSPRYVPTTGSSGHLLYLNQATLFAIPFDPEKIETHGTAVPVLDDVGFYGTLGLGQLSASSAPPGHGTLIYRKNIGGGDLPVSIQWVDPSGKRETLAAKSDVYVVRFSPDGTRLAAEVRESRDSRFQGIWVYEIQREAWTRLTFDSALYVQPAWTPDGRFVFFSGLNRGILWTRADGGGQPQLLIDRTSAPYLAPVSVSPDGKHLAYFEPRAVGGTNGQIWTLPIEETGGQLKAGTPERFLTSQSNDRDPMFSPDGRWIAYTSNESGRDEVYVRPFPPPASSQGGKWQISNSGGRYPQWSRNGRELVYQAGDQIMAASYTVRRDSGRSDTLISDTFIPDKPRLWLAKLGANPSTPYWVLHPDGKRVAVVTPVSVPEAPQSNHQVVFLENFFDELRRKAPAGK